MPSFLLFILFLSHTSLLPLSSATEISAHNRRILHQPFFPVGAVPPSQPPVLSPPAPATPKYPFSTSTPGSSPFFPAYPSPPPPPPPSPSSSTFASFPANISSLILPQQSKSKTVSSKLIATAVAAVVAAVLIVSIAIFLHLRRRRNRALSDTKTHQSDSSSRYNHAGVTSGVNSNVPKLRRPSQASSEFLYLGTLVNSHGGLEPQNPQITRFTTTGRPANPRKLDSPELRPLPPLNVYSFRHNHANAEGGSAATEEDEEFYSPKGSLGGRESSIGAGSASRRAFAAVEVENFDGSSSSSSYSSSSLGSGSPVRSVSLSISPPVSLSPKNTMPKSPELIPVQTAPPPPRPPPPPPPVPQSASYASSLAYSKDSKSPSPSPPSTPLSDQSSRKSIQSSPRISSASDNNVEFPLRISSPMQQNSPVERPSPHSSPPPTLPVTVQTPSGSPTASPPPPPPIISIPFPPPPPPPPPLPPQHRLWESPRTPTPPAKKLANPPPALVTPLRPIVIETPLEISPMELPSASGPTDSNQESADGKGSPEEEAEKSDETPKPKLKPLHWDKVRASSDREMVWDQLKSSSFKLDEEMIETLFIVNTPNPTPKEAIRRSVLPPPSQENRVLDPKKSQNIAILLRALNVTVEEVCEALSEGNADCLGTDLLESLKKMAPTKEEERKLAEYKDDSPYKLGPAEKFLKEVLDVPFAFKRVEGMLYISNFDSEVEYLKKSFETLEAACEELRGSRMFLKLLEAVLKTGNRMNVGTNRGDAHAFKLDTLLKLVDVKGADGKTTLLHFVVQEIIRSEGARLSVASNNEKCIVSDDVKCRKLGLEVVSSLSSELANVKKAAAMESEVLHGDVMKLSQGIGHIDEVVRLVETIKLDVNNGNRFSESMNNFMKRAEEEIIRIQAQESVAMSLVKEITEYFHGNSAKEEAHPFRIFMVVRDFLVVLDRVCKEVGLINERTVVSSAHKFPVPVNPNLQPNFGGFPIRQQSGSSDEESLSS